jgi:hypothetical protein
VNRSAALRLAAGTVALALPLAAAAGCGVEKKKSIKAEFAAAQTFLEKSKAVSVTLRFDDAQGNLAKLAKKDDTPDAIVQAVLKGSITFTGDPAGQATFASLKPDASAADLKASLQKVNFGIVVRDDKAALGELRLVAGDLYARVDLAEVGRLAKAGGATDFDANLDETISGADPRFAQALTDVRAGKWLKLPLAKYLDQLQGLAKSMAPELSTDQAKSKALAGKLFSAVKPYVKVTDANDSSSDRVLDVKVQARPALKALLGVLTADKSLPFGGMLGSTLPSAIDDNVSDGTVHGTITLKNSHLKQFALDVESLRLLSKDPGKDSAAGVRVVVDIDDTAAPVTAPTDLAKFDLGAIVDELLQGFTEQMSGAAGQLAPLTGTAG